MLQQESVLEFLAQLPTKLQFVEPMNSAILLLDTADIVSAPQMLTAPMQIVLIVILTITNAPKLPAHLMLTVLLVELVTMETAEELVLLMLTAITVMQFAQMEHVWPKIVQVIRTALEALLVVI